MNSVHGLILTLILIAGIVSAGCSGEDTPSPGPVDTAAPQPGVLILLIGDVTGQGVILQGVPRGTIDTITFTIGLAPDIKTLDMNNMTIAYADTVRTEIITPVEGYRGDPPPGYWGVVDTVHEIGIQNMRLDYEEQLVIRVNPKAPVVSDQAVTISVKPVEGKALMIRRIAPSIIAEGDNILKVL